ncbi:hypothetical protein ES319_A04G148700v1 [Gossypium barbadense]|uniref:Uncharacterized protein n=2 Tax=Gossypium TaxID=3633 RepID=A0A5J5W9T8_GOSBA|nr:hypothetical protein ES319_A04G148700v1 [Gossypium barbadense]TYH22877.1 hypothetical protein ES288_A04G165500v1 [Gossypium darwinii]
MKRRKKNVSSKFQKKIELKIEEKGKKWDGKTSEKIEGNGTTKRRNLRGCLSSVAMPNPLVTGAVQRDKWLAMKRAPFPWVKIDS